MGARGGVQWIRAPVCRGSAFCQRSWGCCWCVAGWLPSLLPFLPFLVIKNLVCNRCLCWLGLQPELVPAGLFNVSSMFWPASLRNQGQQSGCWSFPLSAVARAVSRLLSSYLRKGIRFFALSTSKGMRENTLTYMWIVDHSSSDSKSSALSAWSNSKTKLKTVPLVYVVLWCKHSDEM